MLKKARIPKVCPPFPELREKDCEGCARCDDDTLVSGERHPLGGIAVVIPAIDRHGLPRGTGPTAADVRRALIKNGKFLAHDIEWFRVRALYTDVSTARIVVQFRQPPAPGMASSVGYFAMQLLCDEGDVEHPPFSTWRMIAPERATRKEWDAALG